MFDNEDEIDETWVNEELAEEDEYNLFYRETPTTAAAFFLYSNRAGEMVAVAKEVVDLDDGVLSCAASAALAHARSTLHGRKYALMSLLRYNHTADARDLASGKHDGEYLSVVRRVDDIKFAPTVGLLLDLNCVIFVFREKRTDASTRKAREIIMRRRKTIKKRA